MPTSRVTVKRLPVCPGRDSRFAIRRNAAAAGAWWVYYEPEGGDPVPADQDHKELVERVNALKEAEGNQAGGGFTINEHGQVIARMSAPSGYEQAAIHVVDVSGGAVYRYTRRITFDAGGMDPSATPAEGDEWNGPRCGVTYTFAAPGSRKAPSNKLDEVWTEIDGAKVQLSSQLPDAVYPAVSGALAVFLAALRRQLPSGGRFRVNEFRRAFTAADNRYIGIVPADAWFRAINLSD